MDKHFGKTHFNRRDFVSLCSTLTASLAVGKFAHAAPHLATEAFDAGDEAPASPWLTGNYGPITGEVDLSDLKVTGQLPRDLNGIYLRNGPNPVYPPSPYHWFDGDGMIHALTLDNGVASYKNRFVQTEGYLEEQKAGRSLYGGLMVGSPFKNAANTSIVVHEGQVFAAWEGGLPHRIDPASLQTKELYSFHNQWSRAFTAHPKIDPLTGEMIFFGYDLTPPYLRYGVLDKLGKLTHSAEIDLDYPVIMHDFLITERYTLFFDLPLTLSDRGLVFKPELGARIGVLPRHGRGSEIRWFKINPSWVFHFLNAHEDGNQIVATGCKWDGWPTGRRSFYEWRLDLGRGLVTESELFNDSCEFPVINLNHAAREHKYGYVGTGGSEMTGVIKFDLQSRTKLAFDYGANRFSGEPFFVLKPGATEEDAGWILNIVHDQSKNQGELVVLHAQDLSPCAIVEIPRRVPFGFHGNWVQS